MPVTFVIASHPAEATHTRVQVTNPVDILETSLKSTDSGFRQATRDAKNSGQKFELELLQSSFHSSTNDRLDLSKLDLKFGGTGFVKMVVDAYNHHHRLVLRPDDVWIAILSQLNLYVNANAEALRSLFVSHEGKKTLEIEMPGTRHTVDFGALALQMADKIQENVILDPSLKDWILPDFSTTTPNDTVICAVMLMAVMQTYFEYMMRMCGIPSITLEGTKEDWENLLQRIDKLPDFGEEPKAWVKLLRPILQRFVQTFDVVQNQHLKSEDNTKAEEDLRDFYSKVASEYSLGSGSPYLSGWITAFCVWNTRGKWQGSPSVQPHRTGSKHPKVLIDGVHYPIITTNSVPMGTCKVEEVILNEPDGQTTCSMVAGHVATIVEGEKDTLRALGAWFIYVKPPQPVPQVSTELPSSSGNITEVNAFTSTQVERGSKLDSLPDCPQQKKKNWVQVLKDLFISRKNQKPVTTPDNQPDCPQQKKGFRFVS